MAQPPLSQQIRKLEHEIGSLLFRRLTRGVELTDAGRVLYEDARRIVDHVEQAKTRAQSAARGQTGHIRVGFASSVVSIREQCRGVDRGLTGGTHRRGHHPPNVARVGTRESRGTVR